MGPICCGDFEFSGLWDWCSKTNSQQAKTEKQAKTSASDGQVEVSLKGGQYIKPPVLNDSEDGTYLALQLEFKNVAKESINVSDSDITIYDAENNKVKLQSGIYDQTEAFQLLKSDQLAQDKKNDRLYRLSSRKRQKIRSAV